MSTWRSIDWNDVVRSRGARFDDTHKSERFKNQNSERKYYIAGGVPSVHVGFFSPTFHFIIVVDVCPRTHTFPTVNRRWQRGIERRRKTTRSSKSNKILFTSEIDGTPKCWVLNVHRSSKRSWWFSKTLRAITWTPAYAYIITLGGYGRSTQYYNNHTIPYWVFARHCWSAFEMYKSFKIKS